ncbi:MAG: cobyric acid synthase [Thermoplasmataceae archaeon]
MVKRPRILQVVGTSSSSGKSTVAMALCRYFSDLGYKVSPFKSVNMSLNSISIEGGFEISRSQWLQARAARAEPEKEMNPILLKPEGGGRSQVIVLGKSMGTMDQESYARFLSSDGKCIVKRSLEYLAGKFDIVIAEGAGSPAEINIFDRDLANMFVSEIHETPALLVADIEKGGVFASIYGTVKLMQRPDLLKWIVINKMRGASELLKSGIEDIERMTGKKIIGVIPFTPFRLPGEDSLDYDGSGSSGGRICVIRYPQMENYSDVDPLITSGVGFSYITSPDQYRSAGCRALLLPGSKNVQSDLDFLFRTGLADTIRQHAQDKKNILGICGGFQMLGNHIEDPAGIQISGKSLMGLGLLDTDTVYEREKTVRTVLYGPYDSSKDEIMRKGYEIHYGTVTSGSRPLLRTDHGPEGAVSESGNVMGTNVHGVLEHNYILSLLSGLSIKMNYESEMEKNIDLFTKAFIESVDLEIIKRSL